MNVISPSRVVRQSLGMEARGIPWKVDATCCMCGIEVKPGDLANIAGFSGGFTDDLDMAVRGGDTLCGDCAAVMSMSGLLESGYGMFGLTDRLPFRKWADIAKALLNPVEPPFVACYATAKSQHMAWRAPVNFSRDVYWVRVGLRSLQIRRQRLLDAPVICARVADALYPPAKSKSTKTAVRKTLPHPFVSLAPDLKDVGHGVLVPRVSKLPSDIYPEFVQDLQWLRTLTAGETWALRFVLTPGAGQASEE